MIAKEISPELKKSVIYQLFFRMFTHEGTISAATEMLESVREIGVDIIYLCPFFAADTDSENISPRQIASGTGNFKNPYRIKDYFAIDEEYGTDDDMKAFVKEAHRLGLKVIFDLVYLHCGPNGKLAYGNLIKRDENGKRITNEYNFPELNFENPELCEIMYSNMELFVTKFDVDGFRVDVGDRVPLKFWDDSLTKLKKLKPELIAINEGERPDFLEKTFDLNYHFGWQTATWLTFVEGKTALTIKEKWNFYNNQIENSHGLRAYENHDIANDTYENRFEKRIGSDGIEAILVLNFCSDGVPVIYNGNEVCDTARHSIFSNRFHGRMCIDWRKALTAEGKHRRSFLKKLSDIRKNVKALWNGKLVWVDNSNPDKVISYLRKDEEDVLVVINSSKEKQSCEINGFDVHSDILKKGVTYTQNRDKLMFELEPYGYVVIK